MAKLSIRINEYFTDDVLETLFSKRIYTTVDFLEYDNKTLSKITNITYKEILDIKKHVLNKFAAKVQRADNYYEYLMSVSTTISTNIKNFDELIKGGLNSGSIYEICGFTSSGKTQLCLSAALNISQNQTKCVYYIDTKRDFSSRRLQNILETRCNEDDIPQILNRIRVKEINNVHELISSLYEIKSELMADNKVPLIIIDSLPAIFYRTGNHSTSLTTMNYFVNLMRLMSVEFNVAFLVTNIMIREMVNAVETVKPGLGVYWSTVPNTRILIQKCDKNICRLTVLKSSTIECNKMCDVTINQNGVV